MSENDVEKAITDYLRWALPRDAVAFHVPLGGFKLTPFEIGRLKRAGYVAGVPDRCILWGGKAYFLECKGPRGVVSDAQRKMMARILSAGSQAIVVRSVDDVAAALRAWGIPCHAMLDL